MQNTNSLNTENKNDQWSSKGMVDKAVSEVKKINPVDIQNAAAALGLAAVAFFIGMFRARSKT